MFIPVKTLKGTIHINPQAISAIEFYQAETAATVWVNGVDHTVDVDEARLLLEEINGNSKAPANELVLAKITTIQRDETKNNQRPMWRCKTDIGHRVNIFLNLDEPAKDNFHLFEKAGWGEFLNSMMLFGERDTNISITMQKNGQWWEIVGVNPETIGGSDA